jgi:hypothetical protein
LVATSDGEKTVKADEEWLTGERKRIEDAYTYSVPRFGRVILSADRQIFEDDLERFKLSLENYYQSVLAALEDIKTDFEDRLVNEYLPRWQEHPPASFTRYGLAPTSENLEKQLRSDVQEMIRKAFSFEAPRVRTVYKNIAPESVRDPEFLKPLQEIMQRRRVPIAVIESLFASGDAAPAKGGFGAST